MHIWIEFMIICIAVKRHPFELGESRRIFSREKEREYITEMVDDTIGPLRKASMSASIFSDRSSLWHLRNTELSPTRFAPFFFSFDCSFIWIDHVYLANVNEAFKKSFAIDSEEWKFIQEFITHIYIVHIAYIRIYSVTLFVAVVA